VKLFQYLYKNCSVAPGKDPSASATFNVTLTRAGKLVSGTTFNGMAVTGGLWWRALGTRVQQPSCIGLSGPVA
jgi:hypothetical protein